MNSPTSRYPVDCDPREWSGTIPEAIQLKAWQQVQAVPVQRWSAYLNAICAEMIQANLMPWPDQFQVALPPEQRPGRWELVSGTALRSGPHRLVLIPTEQIDSSELRVPQEWVDIPSWSAAYYLGTTLDLETGWLRVWCYASLADLRQGEYDSSDRTYVLTNPERDLTQLQVLQQLPPQPLPAIEPIPPLPAQAAQQLISRLGQPQLRLPRLEVPFPLWAALLENPGWQAQLSGQRLGLAVSPLVRLQAWLQAELQPGLEQALATVDDLWQSLQPSALTAAAPAAGWRSAPPSATPATPVTPTPSSISRVKLLTFPGAASPETGLPQPQSSVALMVSITPLESGQTRIGIQVLPLEQIQHGLQVKLLDAQIQVVGQMEAELGQSVQLQFSGNAGEHFGIQVQLAEQVLTEWFEL